MNEKFFDLKKEKQDRMINGAMKVFALNGYRRASTDDMVKEAGISKGLWFHYFDNKLGLYTFVTDYAVKYFSMELASVVNGKSGDYFAVYRDLETLKLSIRRFYPYFPLLIARMEQEKDEEAVSAMGEIRNVYKEKIAQTFAKVDESVFYDAVSRPVLDMTIRYTIVGMMEDAYREPEFLETEYKKEMIQYLDMMESIVCKPVNEV